MRRTTILVALCALLVAATSPLAAPDVWRVLEEKQAALAPADADGLYRVALWAKDQGLAPESRELLARVLRLEPDHRGARRALDYELIGGLWLRGDAAMRAKGFVLRDGKWVLAEELQAGSEKARADEETASRSLLALASPDARTRELARSTLAELPDERVLRPCFVVLERGPAPARLYATTRLRAEGSDASLAALVRTSIMDLSPEVRQAAVSAVRAAGNPDVLYPYLRAISSSYAPVRINAIEALGEVGDIRGVETIIRRLKGVHGGGPRVNISVMTQTSYVRDFDVEIAQAAQIGDPIIGTIQEGVVLDVRVFSVEEEMTTVEKRLLTRTLSKITGQDLGEDVKAWTSWWGENREKLLHESEPGDGSHR